MINQLPYCNTSDAIKGYSESIIAKNESNDCVVRAIASAFEIEYDRAHSFVKETFFRKDRQGVYNFIGGMNKISRERTRIGRKTCNPVGTPSSSGFYYYLDYEVKVKGQKTTRQMTVGTFIKKNPIGTFLVCVRRHAFTIKDGVIIGNLEDSKRTRKIINSAWKVGS
jgi:hypothetical protein